MLGLPKSTDFNKKVPKEKFYEHLNVTPAVKRFFIDQIHTVFWRNKIAPTTVNIAPGTTVTEIEIFELKLKTDKLDESVLRQMDKEIPYHIVFVLEFEGKYQLWTAYKEESNGNNAFKVNVYYHTEWLNEEEISLHIEGSDMDTAYTAFVYQIAGDSLQANENESLQDAVERDKKIQSLKKQIETLQAKIKKEKQLNVQMKLNNELKKLKKELEELQCH